MYLNYAEMQKRLKGLGVPVYQDVSPKNTPYPYFVYSFANRRHVMASGNIFLYISEYRINYFTRGTIAELSEFKKAFADVSYLPIASVPGDENDDQLTNFHTFLEVVAHGRE